MPDSGLLTFEGEGSADFGAGVNAYAMRLNEGVPGNIQYRSFAFPKRLMHGGWVALVYLNGGALGQTSTTVLWHKYLEFQQEAIDIAPNIFCDGIIWAIPLGTVLYGIVYW